MSQDIAMPLQKVLQQSPAAVAKNPISGTYIKASDHLRDSRKPAPFGSPKIKKTNPFYFPTLDCSLLRRNLLPRSTQFRQFLKIMPFKPTLAARSLDLRHEFSNAPARLYALGPLPPCLRLFSVVLLPIHRKMEVTEW
jgi:hypothetical protein